MKKFVCVFLLFLFAFAQTVSSHPDEDGDGIISTEEFGEEYWDMLSHREKIILAAGYHYGLWWGAVTIATLVPEVGWLVEWVAPGGYMTEYMIAKVDYFYSRPENKGKSLIIALWPGKFPEEDILREKRNELEQQNY